MNLRFLKLVAFLAPAAFIAAFEFFRHSVLDRFMSMEASGVIVFFVMLVGAYVFSRLVFDIIQGMQSEILRRNQELAAFNTITTAVAESLDLKEIIDRALNKVLQVTDTEAGEVFLRDEDTQEMVQVVHSGLFLDAFLQKTSFAAGEDFVGLAAETGKPITTQDLGKDSRFLRQAVKERGFRSFASVPLRSKNQVIGVINIAARSQRRFSPQDEQLLSAIGDQIGVAIENARLHERVQGVAAVEERERIAREMHDGLAQILGYFNTKLQATRRLLDSGEVTTADQHLQEMVKMARDAYADVREAILGLRTTISPDRGLIPALDEYVRRFSLQSGIKTELEVALPDGNVHLPPTTEIQLLRIIQESLTNVRRHARARNAWIRFTMRDSVPTVTVEDDGQGFNVAHVSANHWPHFGLQTMRERAQSLGGTLAIESTLGQGTRIIIQLPRVR